MANEKTQVEIDAAVDAAIKVNGNREITPPLHNAIEKMLSNSNLNKKDGGILQARVFYLSAFSLTDPLTLVYKSYVDDLITALNAITQGTNTLTEPLLLEGQVFFVGDNAGNGYISLNNDIGAAQILNSAGDGILLNNGTIEITVSSSLKIEVTSNNVRLLTNLSLGGNPVYYRNAASPSAGDLREIQVGSELQLQEYNGATWDVRSTR